MEQYGRWNLGSGTNLSVFEDRWLVSGGLAKVKQGCSVSRVQELITNPLTLGMWMLWRLCLHPKSAIEALKNPIGFSDLEDRLYWPLTQDVIYSVKSGYKCLNEGPAILDMAPSSSYSHSEVSWKKIWSASVPGRIKQFVWRLKHNAIATSKNLVRRRIARDSVCSICCREKETLETLFFLCLWTTLVWFRLQLCFCA